MRRAVWLVLAVMLLAPGVLQAQGRYDRERESSRRERWERIARVIADCEERTNDFRDAVRRARDRDRSREDDLERDAARLERAVNRIRESWNREHDVDRTRAFLADAISAGRDINRTLDRHRLRTSVRRQWDAIKRELNNLADVFGERRIRW